MIVIPLTKILERESILVVYQKCQMIATSIVIYYVTHNQKHIYNQYSPLGMT